MTEKIRQISFGIALLAICLISITGSTYIPEVEHSADDSSEFIACFGVMSVVAHGAPRAVVFDQ